MKNIGKVVRIQPFSVNDGDGIRTTIFLEGCKLKCKWCSNPDSWSGIVKLGVSKDKCKNCKKCIELCPQNIKDLFDRKEINSKCNLCGECVKNCTSNAICIMTNTMSIEEVVKRVEKDLIFFFESNGGVTFSGGEPTYQKGFLRELVNIFYDKGIDMAIETCGYFDWEKCKDIFEKVDHVFVDIKVMDENKHKRYTGVSNKIILENIKNIGKMNKSIVVRIPIISGINDDIENIKSTANFVKTNIKIPQIELLPYHKYGIDKYKMLGLDDYIYEYEAPSKVRIVELTNLIKSIGVKIVDYK
ncbi:glycyl-radical enzyme activating protein [Romboutsia weinsteinii]|uniref:Glycyl-radical enzyme activating protein n=1 Tax=Romboutsia weinsteinii TaxID=2020949 RepID=A0A371J2P4_9FIRM|nr:glycyl-radical enzyme activating protein [Romboutsia weinsteinii]RDY26995.1 glycyl-radical enzyme activating protein [Romboutsia weinsteinii]